MFDRRLVVGALLLIGAAAPRARALEGGLSYLQPTPDTAAPNHDAPPYDAPVSVPVVRSRMPDRPLAQPLRTFAELNRNGEDVFRQRGALPYLVVGVAALASDRQTEKWFHTRKPGERDSSFVRTFNHFGDGKVVLPAMLVLYISGRQEQRDAAKLWVAGLANAAVWTQSIKMLTGKERPDRSPDAIRYHGPSSLKYDSFPSGHMTVATASAVILGHEYPRMKLVFYTLAAGVGLARIEGLNHWPSDVYWGAGVGYYGARQALRHRDEILRWRF